MIYTFYAVEILHEGQHLWSDLSERAETVLDEHLSGNGLAVKSIELSFEFPYYGHIVTDIILTTTGGRLKPFVSKFSSGVQSLDFDKSMKSYPFSN